MAHNIVQCSSVHDNMDVGNLRSYASAEDFHSCWQLSCYFTQLLTCLRQNDEPVAVCPRQLSPVRRLRGAAGVERLRPGAVIVLPVQPRKVVDCYVVGLQHGQQPRGGTSVLGR